MEALEEFHKIHPHIKFNTFDVVRFTKPSEEKLENRMQEQEMNQSGWSMQNFVKRNMYIHSFYPCGGCTTKLPFMSRYILYIHKTDNKCLLWCLIADLYPTKDHPNRLNNYNKPEYVNEIKLPKIPTSWEYKGLQKIQELNKVKYYLVCLI